MEIGLVSMFIGQKLLTDTITVTTTSIYSVLNRPAFNMYSLDKFVYELDISEKIRTIEAILKEICEKTYLKSDAIKICVDNIHNMIVLIKDDLHKIEEIVLKHKDKWLSGWRSVAIDNEMAELRLHMRLLSERYDLLVKTSNFIN